MPGSGSGRIKDDVKAGDTTIEVKRVSNQHVLKGSKLREMWERATRQSQRAVYVVYFPEWKITAVIHLKHGEVTADDL